MPLDCSPTVSDSMKNESSSSDFPHLRQVYLSRRKHSDLMISQNREGRSPFFCLSLAMTRPCAMSHLFAAHSGEQLVNPPFSRSPVSLFPADFAELKRTCFTHDAGFVDVLILLCIPPSEGYCRYGDIDSPDYFCHFSSFKEKPVNNCIVCRVKVVNP